MKAAIAIVRVSGPRACDALAAFGVTAPPARRASLRELKGPGGSVIDQALVLRFSSGSSFTGEDMVEFQCHGGRAVIAAVLERLSACDGFRMAEPGEFTRRALQNGRLDLVRAEGLADLIDAETEQQRAVAMRQFGGELAIKTADWRRSLVGALALVESSIDFVDEDIPLLAAEVLSTCREVTRLLERELAGAAVAERIRDGFEIALVGRPNVGKSSLLNHLARREMALVSETPGTTRDVLELRLDLRGLPVTVLDMAGVRNGSDAIESAGIARAVARARSADIRVFLVDRDEFPCEVARCAGDLVVGAKADKEANQRGLSVSSVTGAGIDELLAALHEELVARSLHASSLVRGRHRQAVERAAGELALVSERLAEVPLREEFVAEHLRLAIRALDQLIGRVDVEDVLDEIFSRFCLGK